MRIALLHSANVLPDAVGGRPDSFEYVEELGSLTPAFKALGLRLDSVLWDEADQIADQYDAMMPLMVWDYFEGNETRFLDVMRRIEAKTKLFNPVSILSWNSDKSYLPLFEAAGAPIIPTRVTERVTGADVKAAFEAFGTDKIVIKPQVGGGAWRQVLLSKTDPFPNDDELPPEAAMIQPFLPSVVEEGEYSLLFFGGTFSHALIKRPKSGDYRIQSIYGGTEETYQPSASEIAVGERVIAAMDEVPLYVRIDLLRGLDGKLALIEAEMIEPYLYLPHAVVEGGINQGALRLGQALAERL